MSKRIKITVEVKPFSEMPSHTSVIYFDTPTEGYAYMREIIAKGKDMGINPTITYHDQETYMSLRSA